MMVSIAWKSRISVAEQLAIDGGPPVRSRFLAFGTPCLGQAEYDEVMDALRSGWIGTGPKTLQFEQEFAGYVGVPHAVGVNSCTAALHLSLIVSGVGTGDEVITTPLTFAATANVVVHQRARPVFADIDPVTLNIDPEQARLAITPRTKAILPVHFGGLACDLKALRQIAEEYGLSLIEDAAHAVGSRYQGQMIGQHGNLTCFSFYANKNLTTAEGGMITTGDADLADQLQVYRLHGLSAHAWQRYATKALILSEAVAPGYKYNMPDILAALGIHQLRKIEAFLARREAIAQRYDSAFRHMHGVHLQPRSQDTNNRHALHLYVLRLDLSKFRVDRNQILAALRAENIGAALHYRALHTHPYYRETFGYKPQDFPHATEAGNSILSLPLTPCMAEQDISDVTTAVHKVLKAYYA
jgi:dTDP-4-amino-4,6-dideoxygalactose transaminase